jgi:hypothetical protein
MDPLIGAWICVAVAALPVLFGLYRIYFKQAINVAAFCAVSRKLLEAGNPARFEKILSIVEVPVGDVIRFAWRHRQPPEVPPAGGFDGYRQAERPPSYLERMGPVLRPEVERVRSQIGRAWLWMAPAFVPLPVLFVLLGRPVVAGPWIGAGILTLLALLAIPSVIGQRGQVHTALEQLVPLFERYAGSSNGAKGG